MISGTTCYTATDRASTATATTDRGYTSTIREYGDDSTATTTACCQFHDRGRPGVHVGHVPSCQCISIPTTAPTATATARCTDECAHATSFASS